jgi:hypothetical protein
MTTELKTRRASSAFSLRKSFFRVFLPVIGLLATLATAHAQTQTPQRPAIPDPYKLNMMIRTTLIALNHANRTGNYTVLRDLAAPAFQQSNSAARLGEIFGNLRKRELDLSPILFFQPKLNRPAGITDNGLLRMTGFFETKPERISFDMFFQSVGGSWRLFGLAVDVAPPPAAASQLSQAEPAPERVPAEQTQTEPGATQDSAPAQQSEDSREAVPAQRFVPRRVAMPMPMRRPDVSLSGERITQEQTAQDTATDSGGPGLWPSSTGEASAQSAEDTTESGSEEDNGSGWSLWGN